MSRHPGHEPFGCAACWPASADAAWQARRQLVPVTTLVDQSHFIVRLSGCVACGQHFVSAFAETVDWADGDDPQAWVCLPVTVAEMVTLVSRTDPVSEDELAALGPDRRSLRREAPKRGPVGCAWGQGFTIPPHD